MKLPKSFGLPKKLRYAVVVRRVSGASMMPTLMPRQIVIATPWSRTYAYGDIVVFRQDGLDKIKRINDVRNSGQIREIFVVGDNRAASTDSRHFGWVPMGYIRGKVVWPRHISGPDHIRSD